jgi:MFS family permease
MQSVNLTESEKSKLFWASFLSLLAAGVGFAYRVMVLGVWGEEFSFTGKELGMIFGASLWPIAITMILFSLIVDVVGYRISMYCAFALQALSTVFVFMADSYNGLIIASIFAGLGHGVIEAVINPVCASIYTKDKTKMLTILHAAWPAGLAVGGIVMLTPGLSDIPWRIAGFWMLIPVLVYGYMFLSTRFPVDERVRAKVPYSEMLKEVGFLSAFFAFALLSYEIINQLINFGAIAPMADSSRLVTSIIIGGVVGISFGIYTKSVGRILYFFLCVLMVPLATTELGTDAWIKSLMTPSMGSLAGWALVLSAGIMMVLRFFAGELTKRMTPPTILTVSALFSMAGLIAISYSSSLIVVLIAFTLYAVGQTFYWPTVLGMASEQYPRGGALTLNTVSAVGLLSVGIIGTPIMGIFNDNATIAQVRTISEETYQASKTEGSFFGVPYESIDKAKASELTSASGQEDAYASAINEANRQSLRTTALTFPVIMLVCFGLIALWYRSRGGYKPVVLNDES